MRVFILLFNILIFSIFPVFSLEQVNQYVLPKNIYVGDTAEIRYVFHSEVNLLADDVNKTSSELELITDFKCFNELSDKCFVKNASISRIGSEYTFIMEIVTWSAAVIDFPMFDLGSLIFYSCDNPSSMIPAFWVDLKPIEVESIAKKYSVANFRPAASPLLLPGTTILLIIVSVLGLSLIFLLIFSLLKISAITLFLEKLLLLATMKKNSRVAVRKLKSLYKHSSKISDAEFSLKFQLIIREFLNKHFNEDFSSFTTKDFSIAFNRIFLDEVPNEFDRFVEIFYRTDYIRFSGLQQDSKFKKTDNFDEKKSLVEEVIFTITVLGRENRNANPFKIDLDKIGVGK